MATPQPEQLIASTRAFVKEYMGAYEDASHDWAHIQRVERNALRLFAAGGSQGDLLTTHLAALLHDVGDHKYAAGGDSADPAPAQTFLLSIGATAELAAAVQEVVTHVSYSGERRDAAKVREVLARRPELGPVQDADRLDALGAVGIGRCFTYSACRAQREGTGGKGRGSMVDSLEHFEDKLVKLEGMMKTDAGREMARARTERIRAFQGWWREEQEGL